MKLKKDKRNYRVHDDRNKGIIARSLEECGAGRSILADSTGEIIAGNGVFEQAQKLGIKPKIVETTGDELVVVVRKDLKPNDEKRKTLALADNAASDTRAWNAEVVRQDWGRQEASAWGVAPSVWGEQPPVVFGNGGNANPSGGVNGQGGEESAENDNFDGSGLPEEIRERDLEPEELPKLEGDDQTACGRIIITYPFEKAQELCAILGLQTIDKVVYSLDELNKAR